MKKMRKFGLTLMTLLSAGTLLAACGSNKEAKTGETGKSDENVTLRVWWWGNDDRHQATLSMIDNFEKNNSDIKVKAEYVGFGSLDEKITTMITGGAATTPDIIQMDRGQVVRFSPDGKGFYDLSKLEGVDLSGYDEEFLKTGQFNGIQNGVPLGKNVVTVLFNKTAFDKVGAKIPTSWDELKEEAKKFPEGSFPLVLPTPRFGTGIYLQQKTGKTEFDEKGNMNYTKKDYKEALAWYMEMIEAKAFNSRKDYLENVGNEPVSLAQNSKFISGEYAGVLEWTGGIAGNEQALKDSGQELIVVKDMLKNKDAKGSYTIAKPTFLFVISKDEKNPEQAGKFLNDFINGEEANKILGVTRGVPANSKTAQLLIDEGKVTGAIEAGYEYSKNVQTLNQTVFYEDSTLQTILSDALENMELNGLSLDDAAEYVYSNTKTQSEKLKDTYKLK
ncbi:ABC transporter substrate-binding protein [Streptococcus sp. S784/96/1]|uniref:ABC transporter substrate-binding protein n=1 Tax=Streptococcus sp. S784/96/1 TaxID=2653499 RepID=UPI0013869534|nr:ABC transporter substrate-binding protein [Streptococcus sp. S784/96/1]